MTLRRPPPTAPTARPRGRGGAGVARLTGWSTRGKAGPLMASDDRSLRIALLTYRGKPHVGGQGIYVRHLAKALVDLGHHVEVFSAASPTPRSTRGCRSTSWTAWTSTTSTSRCGCPGCGSSRAWPTWSRSAAFSLGTFPEPLAFSVRAFQALNGRRDDFDLVHDNQSLGYGLLAIERARPAGDRHHPPPDHRRPAAGDRARARACYKRLTLRRWYGFTRMQTEVARRLRAGHHRVGQLLRGHRHATTRSTPTGCTSCPWASTPSCSGRCPTWPLDPGASSPPPARTWP